jgi:hypothetical protein
MNTSIPNDARKDELQDEIRRMRDRIETCTLEKLQLLDNTSTEKFLRSEIEGAFKRGDEESMKVLCNPSVDIKGMETFKIKEESVVQEILNAQQNPMFVKEGILEGARMDTLLRACSPVERRAISNIYVPPECRSGNMGDIAKIPEIIYNATAFNRYSELLNDLENGSQCSSIPSDFRNHTRNENGQFSFLSDREYGHLQEDIDLTFRNVVLLAKENLNSDSPYDKECVSNIRKSIEDALGEALKNPLFIKQGVMVGAHISALLHECDKCELQSIVGCHVVRPPEIGEFDKPDAPKIKYIIDDALTHNDYFDLLEDLTDLHPTNKNQSQGRHI